LKRHTLRFLVLLIRMKPASLFDSLRNTLPTSIYIYISSFRNKEMISELHSSQFFTKAYTPFVRHSLSVKELLLLFAIVRAFSLLYSTLNHLFLTSKALSQKFLKATIRFVILLYWIRSFCYILYLNQQNQLKYGIDFSCLLACSRGKTRIPLGVIFMKFLFEVF
jgi:hypothetical protein